MHRISARLRFVLSFFTLLALGFPPSASTQAQTTKPHAVANSRRAADLGQAPMHFEMNTGQTDPRVKFLSRGLGYAVFLTQTEAVLSLHTPSDQAQPPLDPRKRRKGSLSKTNTKSAVVRMRLLGAAPASPPTGKDRLPGTVNYFIGKDPKQWRTKVATFARVQYSDVYPGIDVVYYGNQHRLEYDFVLKPNADPRRISLQFEGVQELSLDANGGISMKTSVGKLTLQKPSMYQTVRGKRKMIDGNYAVRTGRVVGVEVKGYDSSKPLTIDPVLAYSSYLGGAGDESANGITLDSQGNFYLVGSTTSADFPSATGAVSAAPNGNCVGFVSKLNPTGSAVVYSDYIGGTQSQCVWGDSATGIAVDASGQAYVVGNTVSQDFPVTATNAFQTTFTTGATANAFLAKLSSDGQSLLYSTYLGGSQNQQAYGIAIDTSGSAYIAGWTASSDFPITSSNAFQTTLNSTSGNGFISQIDTTRSGLTSLVYSSFFGGSNPQFDDDVEGIAIDSNKNIYVTGLAGSTDFPITANNAFQTQPNPGDCAFVSRLDPSKSGAASLLYSSYLCGSGANGSYGTAIALDQSSNVYVTGPTWDQDFPITAGSSNNPSYKAFVAALNTSLSASNSLIFSRLIGGTGSANGGDFPTSIALDANRNTLIGGQTFSSDFPVTSDAVQSSLGSSAGNGFLAEISPDGSTILYGTYFGGSGTSGNGDLVQAIAVDQNSNVFIAGATDSSDLPTTQGSIQPTLNGTTDAFVAELASNPLPVITGISPSKGGVGTLIFLDGYLFGNQQGSNTVTVNGVTAEITSWSNYRIEAIVPQIASSGPAVVTVGGIPSNPMPFEFLLAARQNPQAVYVSPDSMSLTVGELVR